MANIEDLDPSTPVVLSSLGLSYQEIVLIEQVLTDTFQDDQSNPWDAPLAIAPGAINRLPADILKLAQELGWTDIDDTGSSHVDTLLANAALKNVAETIVGAWVFSAIVNFLSTPTIGGVDVATVNDIPDYAARSQLTVKNISESYTNVLTNDLGKKLHYTGSGDHTITLDVGAQDDIIFVQNATPHVLTVSTPSGTTIRNRYGEALNNARATGRYKVMGFHRTGASNWTVTGDYDAV